ncbi:MAG TPA: hypothetical protein VGL97_19980 [Bryobacteraceae bacterium]|jgi:hypothetical protein
MKSCCAPAVIIGVVSLLFAAPGLLPAQRVAAPGELASAPNLALPASAFSSGTPFVMPKPGLVTIEDRHDRRIKAIWIASIVAMVAGTTADAASSWHKRESNALLASANGTFGAKGVGIKAGIAVGVLMPQIVFRKHKEWRIALAVGNFAQAGIFTGAAIHNFNLAGPK